MSERPEDSASLSADQGVYLAQKYTGCSFSRAEFISFESALSAAILVFENAERAMQRTLAELTELESSGAHRVTGWEGESDLVLDESRSIAADALRMSHGLATVMAAAALERLVSDLCSNRQRSGLMRSLDHLLSELGVETSQRASLLDAVRPVAEARNAFAHGLLGSDWPSDCPPWPAAHVTTPTTLRVVGQTAEALEQLCR